jgi:hypothetical protein
LIVEAIKVMEKKVNDQLEIAKSIVPEKGDKGDRGIDGAPGRDGVNGRDGRDGKDGQNGQDGADGVSVTDAKIDFDGSLIITLSTGREINVGEVVASDLAEKIKVISTMSTNTAIADINGGTINNTVIGGTTPAAGTFTTLTATGQTSLGGVAGSEGLRITTTASAANYLLGRGQISGNNPSLRSAGSDTNVSLLLGSQNAGNIRFLTNSLNDEQLRVSHTASAVNYVQVTGNITSNSPQISFTGSDAGVGGALIAKGNGAISFFNNGATTSRQFRVGAGVVTTAVNYINADGSATGNATQFQTLGTDTNIAMALRTSGTGAIDLAAGSRGVNISNGGTVTAITRTVSGSGYTSLPTVAISAPTTAGGVQATASVGSMFTNTATVQSGGTGYTNGDVLTIVGGTAITSAATYTVTGVSGGAVTSVTPLNFNQYSVLPTNPVSTTGGTGSGATLNLTYGIGTVAFTITNAGSGYVEQPTVTFSGGGGSGAAAYASVGGVTELKFVGTGTDSVTNQAAKITTSAGTAMTFRQIGGSDTFWQVGAASGTTGLIAKGNANGNALVGANGTGSVRLTTNGDGLNEQLRVTHTASAVNYVQVTGAATGSRVALSAQGSDTNIGFAYNTKGAQNHIFQTNSSNLQFVVANRASAANWAQVQGAVAGSSPTFAVDGSDTNIDLTLTPKGTGAVRDVTGGGEQLRVSNTASAVNYVNITGAATGNPGVCFISAQGSDTNISLASVNKGTGAFSWFNGGSTGSRLFRVNGGATNMANHLQIDAAAAGSFPSLSVGSLSADTNVDLALTPKGTGNVRFGTYTANMALTIQGYVEIKDSGGTVRRLAVIA